MLVEIDDAFKIVYAQWREKEITAVKAMKKCNMTKAIFYRKAKEYEKRW